MSTATTQVEPTFEELSREVEAAGLMRPRVGAYAVKIAATLAMLAAGWAAFVIVGDSWWQLAVAAYLGFTFTQIDFIGHDAGHRQIFRTRRPSDLVGYVHGNLLTGVSFGWWVQHHSRHHSYPNHLERDPDILRRQVIFAKEQRAGRPGRVNAFIIAHQSWMFFVLITLEGLRLHLAGFIAAARGALKRHRRTDPAILAVHLAAYAAIVFIALPPALAVAFIAVHQMAFGFYMGLAFAPNHKGLPVRGGQKEELDWLHRQIITSRNLLSSRFTDFMYGGLNYQIEHHLFPSMPRMNLRRARPLVKGFCEQYDIPYVEVTARESYRQVAAHLAKVSGQVRDA
ncbi:MAG TPA: acyl-CoA desaturase [Streptosporangiaceae bacterium]